MKVMFVSYGGGHVRALLPVAHTARARGYEIVFLALTNAAPEARAEGVETIGIVDLMQYAEPDAVAIGTELAREMQGRSIPEAESVAYLGMSYSELVKALGTTAAEEAYRTKGRHAFCPVPFFERVLEAERPDLLIATSAPRSERAALTAARRIGLPSVCVVDLFAGSELEWVGERGFGTRVCVLADLVRERLLGAGRGPEEVEVTGNPAFDRLFDDSVREAAVNRRHELGWAEKTVLAWASQVEHQVHPFTGAHGDPSTPPRIEAELLELAESDESLALWVRRHPSEVRPVPGETSRVRISPSNEPVEFMLHGCDVVVTIASTVGLQGLVCGKPLISFECSSLTAGMPYAEMGMAFGVSRIGDLRSAVEIVGHGGWRASRKLLHPGRSAARVMDVGESVLVESGKPVIRRWT